MNDVVEMEKFENLLYKIIGKGYKPTLSIFVDQLIDMEAFHYLDKETLQEIGELAVFLVWFLNLSFSKPLEVHSLGTIGYILLKSSIFFGSEMQLHAFYKKHFGPLYVSMFLKILMICRSKCFL